ncbi:MAG: hypothetical protein WEB33_13500, partial [Bacteroidota bacterium]
YILGTTIAKFDVQPDRLRRQVFTTSMRSRAMLDWLEWNSELTMHSMQDNRKQVVKFPAKIQPFTNGGPS